jgi:hypothetical protein
VVEIFGAVLVFMDCKRTGWGFWVDLRHTLWIWLHWKKLFMLLLYPTFVVLGHLYIVDFKSLFWFSLFLRGLVILWGLGQFLRWNDYLVFCIENISWTLEHYFWTSAWQKLSYWILFFWWISAAHW